MLSHTATKDPVVRVRVSGDEGVSWTDAEIKMGEDKVASGARRCGRRG
jgi:hypothetical protein